MFALRLGCPPPGGGDHEPRRGTAARRALLAENNAPGSVAQTIINISPPYTWSRRAGLIDCVNPAHGVEQPHRAPSLDFFSKDEVAHLLVHTEQHAAIRTR